MSNTSLGMNCLPGWYGKLPASGDFVHRGLGRAQIQWWDRWLQRGVADVLRVSRDIEAAYLRAPYWNFVLPAGLGTGMVQFGCLGPGRDRVGRSFPLVLVLCVDAQHYRPDMLAESAGFYRHLGASMLAALRHGCSAAQLDDSLCLAEAAMHAATSQARPAAGDDDILSVLNGGHEVAPLARADDGLGWPELPRYFNPHSVSSYWWTNPVEGAAHKSHIHGGALNATLFSRLFLGRARALEHPLSMENIDDDA
ncbi:type VI secretion system-associated protein TagF [Pusillimonas noertemannii]|uniref:type VI secretion system-associated protein TagF n=1 Tax=Pusillimonas noertemannii TaxID=305977 RepID=UPI0003677A9F|nr:type VI secretion system-associated protein TagF [Pusillimonas noertemannii]